MPRVATLVAGPASRKISAAPGDIPTAINPAAIGVEEVAHVYIGMLINIITSMPHILLPYSAKKESGTKVMIAPAAIIPIDSHLKVSL